MCRPKPIYEAQNAWPDPSSLRRGHRGLCFTRFYDGFNGQWQVDESARSQWLENFEGYCGSSNALTTASLRRMELTEALGGVSQIFETQWHFVTGLGLPHPVENGFAWHPTLGTPYLCGAAVKGLLHAWVEEHCDLEDDERQARSELWFGKPEQAGKLIFFDAFPVEMPTVKTDVMTPHMGKWYEKGGKTCRAADARDVDPADWHSPIPVVFLVVKKARFLFTIASRHSTHAGEAQAAMKELERALEEIGAGAKTAVGYGDMVPDCATSKKLETKLEEARGKLIRKRELEAMDPFERSLAKVIARAEHENLPPDIALVQGLERGDWEGKEAVLVAKKAKNIMQEKGRWLPAGGKKKLRKAHKRTLIVQKFLEAADANEKT